MTTSTNSYAIFRDGITFHIINVMNDIAAFLADRTDVIVSLSNHALESLIEGGRVWLEGNATAPHAIICADNVDKPTLHRAVIDFVPFPARELADVGFPAMSTDKIDSFSPPRVKASFGAILAPRIAWIDLKIFLALRAFYRLAPTLPKVRLATAVSETRPARNGAKFARFTASKFIGPKFLVALLTSVSFHSLFPYAVRPAWQSVLLFRQYGPDGARGKQKNPMTAIA